jgi:RimJ/RimL family protein N-acetyltransferase
MLAARGGWLRLPPKTISLEDVMTRGSYRGQGIATAVLTQVGDHLASQGATALLAKVESGNRISQRMLEKAGFVVIAVMDMELRWLRRRVRVIPRRQGMLSEFLAEKLST